VNGRRLLDSERSAIVMVSGDGEILYSSKGIPAKPQSLKAAEHALSPYRHWYEAKKLLTGKDEAGALPHLAAIVGEKPEVKSLTEQAKRLLAPIEKKALVLLEAANEELKAGRKDEALSQFEKLKGQNYDQLSAQIAQQIEEGLAQAGK
jgi:hypothetical protein